MSEDKNQEKKSKSSGIISAQNRKDRLKEIDALYRSQISQIYNNQDKNIQKPESVVQSRHVNINLFKKSPQSVKSPSKFNQTKINNKNDNFQSASVSDNFKMKSPFKYDEKIRASIYLQGQSTKTIQMLRKQNQTKQMKIRDLSDKIQNLLSKLKGKISSSEYQKEILGMKEYNTMKIQRFQSLFKIRNQELFFKIKLQIVNLLQEFQVPKEDLKMIDTIDNQSQLFSYMAKKLKHCLRDFRNKEQQNTFQMQKDKILNQKYQQRIHYLTETNQLMKLTQTKLKQKNEDLKVQLNEFVNKLKERELVIQEKQSENFRLKKEIQQYQSQNSKMLLKQKKSLNQIDEQKRFFQAKQKQYKTLLSNYFLQIKQLQQLNEEKQGEVQQIQIKVKYLEQQIQRLQRQSLKSKQKYQWLQKQKEDLCKEHQEQKISLLQQFQKYKSSHNESIIMSFKGETELTLKKLQDYQNAYNKVLRQLESQKKISHLKNQQYQKIIQNIQQEWLEKLKRLQKIKQEQTIQLASQFQLKQANMRKDFQRKQKMFAQEMQAKMKNLLAQKDKKTTQKIMQLENQNEDLKYQTQNLRKMLAMGNQQSKISSFQNT